MSVFYKGGFLPSGFGLFVAGEQLLQTLFDTVYVCKFEFLFFCEDPARVQWCPLDRPGPVSQGTSWPQMWEQQVSSH